MNVRAAATHVMQSILLQGKSLTAALAETSQQITDPRDRALLQAICYGVCRWYFYLDALAQQLLKKPLKEKDYDLYFLILIGLYQLTHMRVPAYAAVAETVAATKNLKKIWAKALINGVLREYQRRAEQINKTISPQGIYSHPRWMIEKIQDSYPDQWEEILKNNNKHPPLSLRVNSRKTDRVAFIEKLNEANFHAHEIPETLSGIALDEAIDVENIPGFKAGEVSVQDGAAQLAAMFLDLKSGLRVLDACAAPGGKTAHMLELQPDIHCLAIDHDAARLRLVQDNLKRLQLSAHCRVADAAHPSDWWDGIPFDRILLDAPCSASGVIRRHPDIKLLRRASDIKQLAMTQMQILEALWPLLKIDGLLLYATCSIFPEENEQIIASFLAAHPDAIEMPFELNIDQKRPHGKQILPGNYGMDGFFYARLRKCAV